MLFVAMQRLARPVIREHFNADSCIASTRIGINVLRHFGVGAKPLPLSVLVINAEGSRIMREEGVDAYRDAINAAQPGDKGGPWSIGVGSQRSPLDIALDAWQGHLIIEIPQFRTYMDLSIDQANRPLKDIELTPHFFTVDEDDPWLTGEIPIMEMHTEDDVTMVLDRRAPDPEGFRKSTNWNGNNGMSAVLALCTNEIVSEVEKFFIEAGRVFGQP